MNVLSVEARKREEQEFHNRLRDAALLDDPAEHRRLTTNKKYYEVAGSSQRFYEDWLRSHVAGRRVLDFGCGDGYYTLQIARAGGRVTGIDISDVSIENCRRDAAAAGLDAEFVVGDGESLDIPDRTFDIVAEAGVLHHIDFERVVAEFARVLTDDGQAICYEALGHNLAIQAYRRLTPHLRTRYETEHILRVDNLEIARKYFRRVDVRFFQLAALAAVPLRKTPLFRPVLRALDALDTVLLRLPIVQRQAWMMIFVLSEPRRA